LVFKAIFLPVAALALLFWAISAAKGLGPILAQPSKFTSGSQFWNFFFPALTGMVGFWATLSLNIPDFSRYARSQRDQVVGQALGLPLTMALYSFIGVAVTSATTIIYGQTIWDPVDVLTHFTNPIVLVVAMLALCIATLATNIAANGVSPANDFSHVAPHKISFRTGGLFTGIVGIVMMPWKLVADPSGYIFTWLVGYSALLGPIGGIMIADYYVLRHRQLHLHAPGFRSAERSESAGPGRDRLARRGRAVGVSATGIRNPDSRRGHHRAEPGHSRRDRRLHGCSCGPRSAGRTSGQLVLIRTR